MSKTCGITDHFALKIYKANYFDPTISLRTILKQDNKIISLINRYKLRFEYNNGDLTWFGIFTTEPGFLK